MCADHLAAASTPTPLLYRCIAAGGGHPASLILQLRVLPTKKSCTATNAAQRSNAHSMRGAGAAALTQPSRPRDSESIAPPNHRSRIKPSRVKQVAYTRRHEAAGSKLAATGGTGPGLRRDSQPVAAAIRRAPIGDGIAKTSLLIPPLLTYALLGACFPRSLVASLRAPRRHRSLATNELEQSRRSLLRALS